MKTRYIQAIAVAVVAFLMVSLPTVSAQDDFRSQAPEAGPARAIEIGDYETFKLNNGLTVIVVENHKLPVISYQLYIDRDYVVEGEYAGMTGIVSDLLSRGTTTRSKAEIDESVEFVGGSLNTNSRGGFARSLTRHTDVVLELLADVILNPTFPEEEFEKIKTQTISGLQAQKDDPNAISSNVSNALIYGKDHPYGEITTESTVQSVTLDQCAEFYNTYFKPNIAYLVVVGDITPAHAKKKAEKYFGEWKKGDVPRHSYDMPEGVESTQVDFVDKAGAVQSVINITHTVKLEPGDSDVIPVRVMNTILGSGFSGRLFRNLREDKGYTYGAYSSISSDDLVASFSASASVRNEVTDSSVTEFLVELNKMRDTEPTENELELAKNYIAGSFARSLESPQTVASFALNTYRYDLPEDYYATYLERLDAVSVADVQNMAEKYIHPDKARIVVVGNQDEVAKKLAQFDADGDVAFYDIYANEKSPASSAGDVSAEEIVEAYLLAIGGRDAIAEVKSVKQELSATMMGQPLDIVVQQAVPNKFYMEMSMGGMTVTKQVFDGQKGYQEQMGQRVPLEGDLLEEMKQNAQIVPELAYLGDDYALEVKGLEDVNGTMAYKVAVTDPAGNVATEYYAQDSGYKLKAIEVTEAEGQSMTITREYSDYKPAGKIVVPHTMKITGMGPTPLEMTTDKIEVNIDIDPAIFNTN